MNHYEFEMICNWKTQAQYMALCFLEICVREKYIYKKKEAYDTKYSQAVTHPSTNLAQCCLTSVIRRELVCSTWYGRRHLYTENKAYKKDKNVVFERESTKQNMAYQLT